MTKLLDHFKRMQGMAAAYIEPAIYVTLGGARIATGKRAKALRDDSFANDMIYMLDGPEQREAEAELQVMLDAVDEVQHLRDRVAVLTSDFRRANERTAPLEAENNDLRSRLMTSELAYAALRGYADRMVDEQPPVMVPERRESAMARMSDGSFGTTSPDWRQDGSGRAVKHWYHR